MLRRRAFADLTTVEMRFEEVRFEILAPSDARYRWQDYDRNGCHEPKTTEALLGLLNAVEDPVVWDVGSYCGYFARVALEAAHCKKVHVIEPRAAHVGAIKANLNGRAKGVVHPDFLTENPNDGTTGDGLASDHETPNIVKIDVDGGEGAILNGMERTLSTRPYLLVEIHYLKSYESIRRTVIDALNSLVYEYYLCERQRDPDCDWIRLDSLHDLPARPPEDLNDSMLAAIPADGQIGSFPP